DGTLDNSFARLPYYDNYYGFYGECFWFEILSSGKLVVPPLVPLQVGTDQLNGAFRLNSDGTLDSTFNPLTFQAEAFPSDGIALSGGKVLAWGQFDRVGTTPLH